MKAIKRTAGALVLIGTVIVFGAVGGLEQDTFTFAETLARVALGGMMALAGLFTCGVVDNKEKEEE
jgi:hypothetical protein